jgi:putative ABC transport system permease protein
VTLRQQTQLAWRLARRELRGGVAGFRVFLACLTLGVAAIAGVGSISAALEAGMRNDARKILGGDVDLRLTHQPPNSDQMNWLAANGTLSEIRQFRSMATLVGDGSKPDRALIEVKAVDAAYPLFGDITLSAGANFRDALARRDGHHGVVVEKRLLDKLGATPGAKIQIGDAVLRVAAVIEKEPDRATQGFTLGPRVMMTRAALAETGLIRTGSLIRYHTRVAIPENVSVADWRAALHDKFPTAGWRVRDSRNAAPGIRRFVERISMFMTLVGLTALLVGGVGVGNAAQAFLATKSKTIATLKCIGGSGALINAIYIFQIAAIATLGVAAGLVLGGLTPLAVLPFVGAQLPIQAALGVHGATLLKAAAYGYFITLAFSLAPLARARIIPAARLFRDALDAPSLGLGGWRVGVLIAATVALLGGLTIATSADRAIASYFVLGAFFTFGVFNLIAALVIHIARRAPRIRRMSLRMAIANLYRPGAPTRQVVVSLGLGLTVLVAIALVEGNMNRLVSESLPEAAPSYFFIDIQPGQTDAFDRLGAIFEGVDSMSRVPMLRGRITALGGVPADKVKPPPNFAWILRGDRGITWSATPPKIGSTVVEGEWWPADYKGPPLLSFDAGAARALGLGVGDIVELNILGRQFSVKIANLRTIDWTSLGLNFVMILSPGMLDGAPQSHIATAHVVPEKEAAFEAAVGAAFPNVSTIRIKDILGALQGIIANLGHAVRVIALIALASGALVLAGAVAANQQRRIYDSVILKVLGATRREVLILLAMEFALLGVITGVIAAAFGALASWGVVTHLLASEWRFMPGVAAMAVLVCAVATGIAGLAGTSAALGQKSAPLLRNR